MEKADILQETIRFVEISLEKEKKRSWEVSTAFMQGYTQCVQDMEVHIRSRAGVVTSCDDVMQSALSRVREEAEKRKHEIQGRFSVAPVCSQITPQTPGGQGINVNQQIGFQQQPCISKKRQNEEPTENTSMLKFSIESSNLGHTNNSSAARVRDYTSPLFIETENDAAQIHYDSLHYYFLDPSRTIAPDTSIDCFNFEFVENRSSEDIRASQEQIWRPW